MLWDMQRYQLDYVKKIGLKRDFLSKSTSNAIAFYVKNHAIVFFKNLTSPIKKKTSEL